MARILFVTNYDLSGTSGADVATRAVIRALGRQADVELSLLAPIPGDGADLGDELPVARWVPLPSPSHRSLQWHAATSFRVWWQCRRLLAEDHVDLVAVRHGRFFLPTALLFPRDGCRLVLLVRGSMRSTLGGSLGRLITALTRLLTVAAARRADQLIFAYQAAVELMGESVPSERLQVIPNAADLDAFPWLDKVRAREEFPGGFPWDLDRKVVGFVGSVRKRHRLEELLHASVSLRSRGVHHGILLVGDGPVRSTLEAMVRDLQLEGNVCFVGRVSHASVARYVAACDLLYGVVDSAIPSNPIKVYEALAAGRPVVTSPNPELSFVRREGLGIVTDAEEPKGIADAIERGLCLRWTAAEGERARDYIRAHHTWEVLARAIVESTDGGSRAESIGDP